MKRYGLKIASIIVTAIAVGSAPVIAGGYHHGSGHCGGMNWDMSTLDNDQDGKLTFEEYVAPNQQKWKTGFDMIDTDGNGVVDSDEWESFLTVHGKTKQ